MMPSDTAEKSTPAPRWQAKSDSRRSNFLTKRHRELLISFLSPLSIVIIWELLVRTSLLDARFFPAPTAILGTFWDMVVSGELLQDTLASLSRLFVGFTMGTVPALCLGIIVGRAPTARAFVTPLVYALYPIPKVAILPLVMLIFGLGEMSKYVIIAIAVFFLNAASTISAVALIDRAFIDVARNFEVSKRHLYLRIILPAALPTIFTGLRLSLGVALIVLVTAEFVGADQGLGVLIFRSWQVFAIEKLFVGLVTISILGYVLTVGFDEIERIAIPWKRN